MLKCLWFVSTIVCFLKFGISFLFRNNSVVNYVVCFSYPEHLSNLLIPATDIHLKVAYMFLDFYFMNMVLMMTYNFMANVVMLLIADCTNLGYVISVIVILISPTSSFL